MSKDVDTIQFRNDNGDYVYAKTHFDAIDGMEEYTEGLTQVAQILKLTNQENLLAIGFMHNLLGLNKRRAGKE